MMSHSATNERSAARSKQAPGRAATRNGNRERERSEVVQGERALARCEWERARACFEAALLHAESAGALEGLGMAAFWLDDARAVFDARQRAYRLYRKLADPRGAARMALALADDYLSFRAQTVVSRGWLERARRLLDDLPASSEQGWLKLYQGYFALVVEGDPLAAQQRAAEGLSTARGIGDTDLEMTALAQEGLALVMQGNLAEGMPRLDQATTAVIAGEMCDALAVSRTCCMLVAACERSRDFERAAQWCRHIERLCERSRLNFPLAICRAAYAVVLGFRGLWAEAERELTAALAGLATRPALEQEALAGLAELRRRQGRFEEAAALLQRVEGGHPLALLSRAALALDRADPALALRLARRFLRQLSHSNHTDRVDALDVLLRAQAALGQQAEARATFESLRAINAGFSSEPLKAQTHHAEGLVAFLEGDSERARDALEDAIECYLRSGAPFEVSRCRVELARVLAAQAARDAADAELREALSCCERLGATHLAAQATALRNELLQADESVSAPEQPATGLTRRELEVLRFVAQGLTNQKIAQRLSVSEFTIKRHVANLLGKLRLRSRAAAAAYAARAGLA
jgi:DNA-binding NarL/FixJ family response regulator